MSDVIAVIETNKGSIEVKLIPEVAPKTCENFTNLIQKGYYDGIVFHRVIPDFMVQGGDPTGTGMGGESMWGNAFEDEFDPAISFNKKGMLAMANSGPNSNGSQFFITVASTPWLHMRHTIFGKVIDGYDVVESISEVERDQDDRPLEDIVIKRASVREG